MLMSVYRDSYLFYADEEVNSPQEDPALSNISEAHALFFCETGLLSANVEGVAYTVHPGEILIVRDAEVYRIEPAAYPTRFQRMYFSPFYYYIFDRDYRFLRPFQDRELGIGCLVPKGVVDPSFLKACFHAIDTAQDAYLRRITVFGALTMILSEINNAFPSRIPTDGDTRSELLLNIITYINDHLDEELNPDKIASVLYISRSQLDRIFKQNLGFTLWKYITFKRLIRARHLLHSGMANNEVAHQCGFGDYSTFYKVYTKTFGTPPRAAHPNDTTDPLLKQFYQFDESSTSIDAAAEQQRIPQRTRKLRLD